MLSLPLNCTERQMMSRVSCNYHLWKEHKVRRSKVFNAIITLVMNTQMNNVGRGILSPPVDSTHGWETSVMAWHDRPWTAHTVGRRRAWNEITALGQHTRSNYIGRGMTSLPLDSTHGRKTLGKAFHHRLWAARTDKRRWARHDITALGQHTRSTTLGVACHHRP